MRRLPEASRAWPRVVSPDSELAEAIEVLARSHQNLIWKRQRQVNGLTA